MIPIKQSTAYTFRIGPFLDEDDGKTVEGSLTITQPDVRLSKDGGDFAQINASMTLGHDEAGWYTLALDTTDTSTVGTLVIAIHESGALPVWVEYFVVEQATYEFLYQNGATPLADIADVVWDATGTDHLGADSIGLGIFNTEANVAVVVVDTATDLPALIIAETNDVQTDIGNLNDAPAVSADTIANTVWDELTAAHVISDSFGDLAIEIASIQTDTDDIQTRLPTSLVGGAMDSDVSNIQSNTIDAASVATGAIDAASIDSDLDVYQAKVWLLDDDTGTNDRYACSFYLNGGLITADVTVPDLWVFTMASSPGNLVGTTGSPQALTEAGSTETWFHNESSNRVVSGVHYMARVQFTHGGGVRTWMQPVGRDN